MNAERWLPKVPGAQIERSLSKGAYRREIAPRENAPPRIDSKVSSAALVMNAFGYFFEKPSALPLLPDCKDYWWPPRKLMFEKPLNFPWKGGRHPELDVVVSTKSVVLGIESKRYESFAVRHWTKDPFSSPKFREAQWWAGMSGYKAIRDRFREFTHLDVAQLVKHALGLQARVQANREFQGLCPVLFYLYAEPELPDNSGKLVDDVAKAQHRKEICEFAKIVKGNKVEFLDCDYRQLLAGWQQNDDPEIAAHAARVIERFAP